MIKLVRKGRINVDERENIIGSSVEHIKEEKLVEIRDWENKSLHESGFNKEK